MEIQYKSNLMNMFGMELSLSVLFTTSMLRSYHKNPSQADHSLAKTPNFVGVLWKYTLSS